MTTRAVPLLAIFVIIAAAVAWWTTAPAAPKSPLPSPEPAGASMTPAAGTAATAPSPSASASASASSPAKAGLLRGKLQRLRDTLHTTITDGSDLRAEDLVAERKRLLRELRPLILANPAVFLEFMKEDDECLGLLLAALADGGLEGALSAARRPYAEYPAPLMDGLIDLLPTRSPAGRRSVLWFFASCTSVPERAQAAFLRELGDENEDNQRSALEALGQTRSPVPASAFPSLKRLAEHKPTGGMGAQLLYVLSTLEGGEARAYLFQRLETEPDVAWIRHLVSNGILAMARRTGPDGGDDFVPPLVATIARVAAMDDPYAMAQRDAAIAQISQVALYLPPSRGLPILQMAASRVKSTKSRETLEEVMRQVTAGGADPEELTKLLFENVR